MKKVNFQDLDGQDIQVQLDSGNGYRIYVGDRNNEDRHCIHLSENQALILINSLEDLIDLND